MSAPESTPTPLKLATTAQERAEWLAHYDRHGIIAAKVGRHLIGDIDTLLADRARLERELGQAWAAADALDAKLDALAPHSCGCSYDKPGDLCLHHSPQLVAMEARALAAEAENDKLRSLLAHSDAPCPYCSLPKADMARCLYGFPGCGRADDMVVDSAIGEPAQGAGDAIRETVIIRSVADARRAYDQLLAKGDTPTPEKLAECSAALARMDANPLPRNLPMPSYDYQTPDARHERALERRGIERFAIQPLPTPAGQTEVLTDLVAACEAMGYPMSDAAWGNVGDDAPVNHQASVQARALHRAAAKAQSVLAALPPASPWRAIETAPYDVDVLLVGKSGVCFIASRSEEDQKFAQYSWWDGFGHGHQKDAFTHWMPLPSPPANKEG